MNERINPKYWLRIAREVGKAATCKANVGCVLVHKKMIVGMGYVGSIHGDEHCDTAGHINLPVDYRGEQGETCIRTVHAEINAILKCMVRGSSDIGFITCYSTHEPCYACTLQLLQIGVRDIYYIEPYQDTRRDLFLKRSNVRNWGYGIASSQVMMEDEHVAEP
jgi:dCMP deaminase